MDGPHLTDKVERKMMLGNVVVGERRCVYLQYELGTDAGRTADAFLADWAAIVHLHTLLHDFMLRPKQGNIVSLDSSLQF